MKDKSCHNCYFFLPREDASEAKREKHKNDPRIGFCRANPPQPYYEMGEDGKVTPKVGRFPIVLGNMWCGMWDSRDEEQN